MRYINTLTAKFIDRPNRFIAHVELNDGSIETVHVKNTGRCRELLIPGVEVVIQDAYSDTMVDIIRKANQCIISNYNPERKTRYDLISVYKKNMGWINIDSQVPNKVVNEWLHCDNHLFNNLTFIKPEYKYGDSRVDFYLEDETKEGIKKILMEVKGCTLEIGGKGYFPDAPTKRGAKHLKELSDAVKKGYDCYLVFVIAMNGIDEVHANVEMDPDFGEALEKAKRSGVKVINLPCLVTGETIITRKDSI